MKADLGESEVIVCMYMNTHTVRWARFLWDNVTCQSWQPAACVCVCVCVCACMCACADVSKGHWRGCKDYPFSDLYISDINVMTKPLTSLSPLDYIFFMKTIMC